MVSPTGRVSCHADWDVLETSSVPISIAIPFVQPCQLDLKCG